jgi:hypothetical protein
MCLTSDTEQSKFARGPDPPLDAFCLKAFFKEEF